MISTTYPQKGALVVRRTGGWKGKVIVSDPSKDQVGVEWSMAGETIRCLYGYDKFIDQWELTGKVAASFQVYAAVAAGLLILVILIAAFVFSRSPFSQHGPDFQTPQNVQRREISYIDGNPMLEVTLSLPRSNTGEAEVYTSIADMKQVMRNAVYEGTQVRGIVFHLVEAVGGGTDDYGNSKPSRMIADFDLQYSMDDVRRINWRSVTSSGLLNLSKVTKISPTGAVVAHRYCERNRDSSEVFCKAF